MALLGGLLLLGLFFWLFWRLVDFFFADFFLALIVIVFAAAASRSVRMRARRSAAGSSPGSCGTSWPLKAFFKIFRIEGSIPVESYFRSGKRVDDPQSEPVPRMLVELLHSRYQSPIHFLSRRIDFLTK
ncbi:MAG: hypothetical protein R3F19_03150 [Verrucomicrobiales bacterium]